MLKKTHPQKNRSQNVKKKSIPKKIDLEMLKKTHPQKNRP